MRSARAPGACLRGALTGTWVDKPFHVYIDRGRGDLLVLALFFCAKGDF